MTADATIAIRPPAITRAMTLLLAAACGLIAANLYYTQPLAGPIAAELGLSPKAAGLIVTMTQLGYGAGLLLIVPLGDLVENRRLVLALIIGCMIALMATAFAPGASTFLAAATAIGVCSVAVQIIVPYASHMADDSNRGRVVGDVMGGLMAGIMLSRPTASFIAASFSWHAVFIASTGVMAALGIVLARALPEHRPAAGLHYGELLASLGKLFINTAILRRRAFYQACQFAAFSLFWTTTPLLLAQHFGLSQRGIALFALVGAAGAVAAPLAGRLADRGLTRPATVGALSLVALAFLTTHIAAPGSVAALLLLGLAAILLDFGVQTNVVLGQRQLFTLGAHIRSRLNGLYIACFFVAGAFGSAVGAWAYAQGGWALASAIGLAFPVLGLIGFATE